jgi:hypothetical protein
MMEAGLEVLAVVVAAVVLVDLAAEVQVAAVRGAVGSGVPGVPTRPGPTLTGETPVAPLARNREARNGT